MATYLPRCPYFALLGFVALLLAMGPARSGGNAAAVELVIVDKSTGRPLACRIHLQDRDGTPQRAGKLPFWHDHFVCPGRALLDLSPGRYTYQVERGPEYRRSAGDFTVEGIEKVTLKLELERLADLASAGWWSGELHVHRPVADVEMLMRAEDLHVAPVITWWNDRNTWAGLKLPDHPLIRFDDNRYYHVLAGEDEREGGALLFFNLPRPLAIAGSGREYPSPMRFVTEARQQPAVWIDVEKPFWWDVPVWLASGEVDSIGIANNHMCRSRMYEDEAWGKPRPAQRLPPPLGNGYWTQEIYYHLLNTGLRIPPSAGSASGVLPNPVGYNRVYVYTGKPLVYEDWWRALRAGRSFVTNGPLLRVRVNDELPGYVFTAPAGQHCVLQITAELVSQDPIRCLEIIKNGRVERTLSSADWRENGLGRVVFDESGWFLVRAIADNAKTFRFASTAPFYVEIGPVKGRISKTSARFFLDWVRERSQRIKLADPEQRREVLRYHETAEKFWEERVAKANAE
jgi:hypothetical protein